MEYESIKNNSGIISKFPGIKMATVALREVLDSDDDREQDPQMIAVKALVINLVKKTKI